MNNDNKPTKAPVMDVTPPKRPAPDSWSQAPSPASQQPAGPVAEEESTSNLEALQTEVTPIKESPVEDVAEPDAKKEEEAAVAELQDSIPDFSSLDLEVDEPVPADQEMPITNQLAPGAPLPVDEATYQPDPVAVDDPVETPPAETAPQPEPIPTPTMTAEPPKDPENAPTLSEPTDENPPATAAPTTDQQPAFYPAVVSQKIKHGTPIGIIVAIVALVLLLAGVTGFAILKIKNGKKTSPKSDTTSQQTTTSTINSSDVDQSSQLLDTDLSSVDENTDFNATDLSDSTLGL